MRIIILMYMRVRKKTVEVETEEESFLSDQKLTEQKEWQGLENDSSKVYDKSYSLNKANENYDREKQYLYEAQEKESGAYDDFRIASRKYDKAKGLLDENVPA